MKKNERGFSIVEMMMTIALGAIIAYMISNVMRLGNDHSQVMGTRLTIQDSARQGLTRMLQEIRETAPTHITWTANNLIFQIPTAVSSSGVITWSGNIQYALGGIGGQQLIRTDPIGTKAVIANDVQQIIFTGNSAANPTLMTVQLNVLRSTIQGRNYLNSLTGQAEVRNA